MTSTKTKSIQAKLQSAMKAADERAVNRDYADKIANIGDTVTWQSMDSHRCGKVIKVTAKTVHVKFPTSKYDDEATISLKRAFPTFGQLKGRFNQFRLESGK